MRAEYGFCMVCDKEIADKCGSCSEGKVKNGHYTEVEVQWSNASRMKIALCKDCATSHAWTTSEAKKGLTQAHWDAWDKTGHTYSKEIVMADFEKPGDHDVVHTLMRDLAAAGKPTEEHTIRKQGERFLVEATKQVMAEVKR